MENYYVESNSGCYHYTENDTSAMSRINISHKAEYYNNIIICKLQDIIKSCHNTLAVVVLFEFYLNDLYKSKKFLDFYKSIGFNDFLKIKGISIKRKLKILMFLISANYRNQIRL